MNTKFCPSCGKELPAEAVFCPYCMTKLIDVKTGEAIKIKKHRLVLPIVLAAAVIVLAAIGLAVFFAFRQSTDTSSKANETTALPTEIATTEATKADYSSYIGLWCDKDSSIADVTENGGNLLEIISIKEDVVRFTFTKTSSSAFNRIARISNVTCQIIDGTATFSFDNDNWLNSGTGKIKFLDDEIYLETNITNRNDSANWDIGGTFYLCKSDNSIIDFKNYDYLGANFNEVKNHFGEEIAEAENFSDKWYIHSYSGFNITELQETNKIVSILVEYSPNGMTKSSVCYGVLNGNSTYDDVYAEMGEPTYNMLSGGNVAYVVDGNYLTFYFDDNMNLTKFVYKLENTH